MSTERWLPVADHPSYEVSDLGRVRSLDREIFNRGSSKVCSLKGKVLRSRSDKDGYRIVDAHTDGGVTTLKIHRAVATAFLANPECLPEINHGDFDKSNNVFSNLEWTTRKGNVAHAHAAGKTGGRGRKIIATNLSGVERLFASVSAAAAAGFHRGAIHYCLTGRWAHHRGLKWRAA